MIKVTSMSGAEVNRAVGRYERLNPSSQEDKVRFQKGLFTTPECRIAEAIQIQYPAPQIDYDRKALADLLAPTTANVNGQIIPRNYLLAFRGIEQQIHQQTVGMAKELAVLETKASQKALPKNQPLVIKNISWPKLPESSSGEEQEAVKRFTKMAWELISRSASNQIGDFHFKGVKFVNSQLNGFDFSNGLYGMPGQFSGCELEDCKSGSAKFNDTNLLAANQIAEPNRSEFNRVKLNGELQESESLQKHFAFEKLKLENPLAASLTKS